MNWINVQQQAFYRSLTGALKAMREDGCRLWLMVGLSFAYGIFHAAGPGHGKAVISSYMLANEVALKRGVMLSFVSAFLQALTAIIVMTLAFLVLRGTSVSMTDATWFLEVSSYALISAFGAWLLWRKAGPLLLGLFGGTGAQPFGRACACARSRMARAMTTAMPAHSHHAGATRMPMRRITTDTIMTTMIMATRITTIMGTITMAMPRARSARPAAIRTRRTRSFWAAIISAGRPPGRRSPRSGFAPAPAR